MRTLKRGMSGDDVVQAKQRLFALGFYAEHIKEVKSRSYGADTVEAVKRFQMQNGLTADGVIGEKTWNALFEGVPAKKANPSEMALRMVDLARSRLGDIYVWGASGMTDLSDSAIKAKDSDSRAIAFRDKQTKAGFTGLMAHDCSGFISWLMRQVGAWNTRRDCDELWKLCTEVQRSELIKGDYLFRVSSSNSEDETHIGLYCGRGIVIHDKGRDVGVVLEGINHGGSGYWHKAGRCKLLY